MSFLDHNPSGNFRNTDNKPDMQSTWYSKVITALGWRLLAAIIGAIVLLLAFVYLAEEVFDKEFLTVESNLALWVHSFANPFDDKVFYFFSLVGGPGGILILSGITFLFLLKARDIQYIVLLVLVVGGGLLLDVGLKQIFQRTRPDLWNLTGPHLTSYGFPSGHATGSMSFFAFIAWLTFMSNIKLWLKWLILLLMAFFTAMVGLCRIYLGVHYPTDVLGGYILGGSWLTVVVSGFEVRTRFLKSP
ncbi:MAG TPA: phosphatase PAP2 family protein [Chloroflexia bacterium]|nr:phosphatase PAP2 family protein [Chloroflexia bacterium]